MRFERNLSGSDYWDAFYSSRGDDLELSSPTQFAQFIVAKIDLEGALIIDWGAGNGRDSFYLAKYATFVLAVEQSNVARKLIQNGLQKSFEGKMTVANTGDADGILNSMATDTVRNIHYSRFVIHSLNEVDFLYYLNFVNQNTSVGDYFVLEYRSQTATEAEYFFPAHERFFRSKERVDSAISDRGFNLETELEGYGLAIFKNEDPLIVRQIWKK